MIQGVFGSTNSPRTLAGLLLVGMLTLACHRGPTPYRNQMLEAEAARRAKDFEQERQHFEEAARLAKTSNDAAEALYRAGESYVRQGNAEEGALHLEKVGTNYPNSARAARAWLDAGRAWERANNDERALSAYGHVLNKYATSGGALSAARRIVALRTEQTNRPAHELWRELLSKNQSSELDEALRYHYAKSLEEVSEAQALVAYQDVAQKHPLPRASYSDEALLRAAQLRRKLGDHEGALKTLRLLGAQGGRAAIVGSYTRTAYIEAVLLEGRILRDDLKRPADALRAFRSLVERYKKSRLVDDALWEVVVTEFREKADACGAAQRLEDLKPDSRFVRCVPVLCSSESAENVATRACSRWLESPP